MRLLCLNVVAYFAVTLLLLICALNNSGFGLNLLDMIELPSAFKSFIYRPWSLLTYMFVHTDLLHLIFNMFWLYWTGSLLVAVGVGKHIAAIYFIGGISGALIFMLASLVSSNADIVCSTLAGSSASVLALMASIALLAPRHKVTTFIGEIPLLCIVGVVVIYSVIPAFNDSICAHVGGLLSGICYGCVLRVIIARQATTVYAEKVLEKLQRIGFSSLTDEEKRCLIRQK